MANKTHKQEISNLMTKLSHEIGRRKKAEAKTERLIELVAKCEKELHWLRNQLRRNKFQTLAEYKLDPYLPKPIVGSADHATNNGLSGGK